MIGTSTKKLFLMRHAKSDWADASLSDKDRPLNARGRASATLMAQWMQSHQSVPDVVLCSTALRTRQTLELLTENWSSGSTEIHFL
ncbi:MAG: SixA phosphatase family protein, partial [Pirellula staleyi]